MRTLPVRLLVVIGAALCLWLITPGTASAASDCGGAGYRNGASQLPFPDESPCNNYASNGAKVVAGLGAAFAIGLGYTAYRRGSRGGPLPAPPTPRPVDPQLTETELAALKDYSSHGYETMNSFLRAPSRYHGRQRGLQARSDSVSVALARLPPRAATTYRGVTYSSRLLDRYEPGRIVTERAFTSTSAAPRVALDNFKGNVTITVTGRTGRNIAGFSALPHEAEILYDRGTRFKVLSKKWNPTVGMWFINLLEVP